MASVLGETTISSSFSLAAGAPQQACTTILNDHDSFRILPHLPANVWWYFSLLLLANWLFRCRTLWCVLREKERALKTEEKETEDWRERALKTEEKELWRLKRKRLKTEEKETEDWRERALKTEEKETEARSESGTSNFNVDGLVQSASNKFLEAADRKKKYFKKRKFSVLCPARLLKGFVLPMAVQCKAQDCRTAICHAVCKLV